MNKKVLAWLLSSLMVLGTAAPAAAFASYDNTLAVSGAGLDAEGAEDPEGLSSDGVSDPEGVSPEIAEGASVENLSDGSADDPDQGREAGQQVDQTSGGFVEGPDSSSVSSAVSEDPSENAAPTPMDQSAATPEDSSADTPEDQSAATPQDLSAGWPEDLSATTPADPSAVTPEDQSSATPADSSSADPGDASSENPENPASSDLAGEEDPAFDPEEGKDSSLDPDDGTGLAGDPEDGQETAFDPDAQDEHIPDGEEEDLEEGLVEEESEDSGEEAVAGLSENKALYKPANGFYVIDTTLDGANNLSLEDGTAGLDLLENTKAVISTSGTDCNVYWQLVKNDDNSYQILSFESGLALTASGKNVVQKPYTGAETQKWLLRRFGSKTFTSFAPKSDTSMRLSLAGNGSKYAADGKKVVLSKSGAAHQMWYLKSRTSPAVALADGKYYLYPGNKTERAVYVTDNSKEDDASVVLYKWLGRRGQWFTVKSLGKGNLYAVTNTYSGKSLYPAKGGKSAGTKIVQHTADDSLAMTWRVVDVDGKYRLVNMASDLALSLKDGKYVVGTALELAKPASDQTQLWSFVEIDTVGADTKGADAKLANGYYRLSSASDKSLVASVNGGVASTGADLALADSGTKERATFYIKSVGGGKYTIRSFWSMKYLGMNYDTAENNYKIVTRDNAKASSSKWYIRKSKVDSEKLSIVNANNPALVMTVDGSVKAGDVLRASLSTGAQAERWTATKMATQRPLTDGQTYVLASQLNTKYVLGVSDRESGTGTSMLRTAEQQPWECYTFEYAGINNVYRIRNQWSGLVLQVSGTRVSLVEDSSSKNQLWHVRAMGSARYNIANVGNGKLLTVKDGSAANGTEVVANKESGKSAQLWVMHKAKSVEKVPTEVSLTISPKGTNNVVEVRDGSLVDRTPVQFAAPAGLMRQVFQIIPSGNYYKIKNVATGRYLTSSNGKVTSRVSISSKAQLWRVIPSGIRYLFKNVGNGKYLNSDVETYKSETQLIMGPVQMASRLSLSHISGWQYVSAGLRCYNEDGTYKKDAFLDYNGNTVYVGSDGQVKTGWLKYGAYYFYFNGTAGQVKSDARPYLSQLYPERRAGFYMASQTGPACNYRITVDRQHPCQVTVYTQYPGQAEFNVPVVSYLCSTGADDTQTAPGERKTVHAGRWQELMGPSYGQFGMVILLWDSAQGWFINGDFFHSLACGEANDHNLDPGSYNRLGNRASHGCVRLCVRNAYWQYNFIPDNTSVYVGDNLARPLRAIVQPYANANVDPTDPNYTGNYGYTENGVFYNPAGFH